ncbi:MAG: hypothetical protein CMH12_15380 [Maritimibacter sp.]|nr:hypothetical protein [Maritimibacter sp.]
MSLLLGWPRRTSPKVAFGFTPSVVASDPGPVPDPVRDPHDEGHWLVVAPTGSGKSASFAIPQLLSYPGAIVVIDVKGELANVTARYRRTLGEVLILDPFRQVSDGSGQFNPLAHISVGSPEVVDDAYTIAELFSNLSRDSARKDPFWDEAGQDIIAALIVQALHEHEPSDRSLAGVYESFSMPDQLQFFRRMLDSGVHPFVEQKIGAYLRLAETTRTGIEAVAGQQLRMLAGEGVRRCVSGDTIPPRHLADGRPVTIYLVIPPDRLASHGTLVRILLTAMLRRMLRRKNKPERPTLLLVDEAAQLGRMPALTSAITLGRGFGIRAALLVQSLSQLSGAYGRDYQAIAENCSLLTMGGRTGFAMAEHLSTSGFGDVTPECIYGLSETETMIRANGQETRRLRKLDYRADSLFAGKYDDNPLYERAC